VSETWWVADRYKATVKPITVTKSSEQFVTYEYCDWNGRIASRRQAKDGSSDWIRPTFEQAKMCLVSHYADTVSSINSRLAQAKNDLEKAQGLQP